MLALLGALTFFPAHAQQAGTQIQARLVCLSLEAMETIAAADRNSAEEATAAMATALQIGQCVQTQTVIVTVKRVISSYTDFAGQITNIVELVSRTDRRFFILFVQTPEKSGGGAGGFSSPGWDI